ncbi:MAG: hypothetical protein LPJ89_02400 [Hymenobacteraceae bacterium]|nr:hypothetical protein [Hymenobacteraceae bacterium]MDX5394918.1 hypothetical protein [Hymenobacteraceae bacterium]MDX5442616.1 hypothetical protein [Hymenobacteraceae bacterium]MDX5510953.1 hypothetical protein [Hymenobacteraceae bacterium]
MQQNEQTFPPAFFSSFYNESLFLPQQERQKQESATEEPTAENTTAAQQTAAPVALPFSSYGENRKGLVVATRLPENEFKKLAQNEFLTKVLQAINFGMQDVLFVNLLQDKPMDFLTLQQETNMHFLVVFGENVLKTQSAATKYQPVKAGKIPVLLADGLVAIEGNQDLKRKLWNSLKQMFLA